MNRRALDRPGLARLAILRSAPGLLLLALVGCASDPIPYRGAVTPVYTSAELAQMPPRDPEAAYLHIHTEGGNRYYPRSLTLNGEPLAVRTDRYSYVELPVVPGRHRVDSTTLSQGQAPRRHPTIELDVVAGESVYLGHLTGSVWDAPRITDAATFAAKTRPERRVKPLRPVSAYLPEALRGLLARCATNRERDACRRMRDEIPAAVIPPQTLAMAEALEAEAAVAAVRTRLEPTLSDDVLRDKYTLALTRAMALESYAAALPLFDRLQRLGGARDPDLDFFHGEALLESGHPAEATAPLSRYLSEQGPEARHYTDALRLLNRAQEAL